MHLLTECPRLRTQRNEIFLDKPPDKFGNWKTNEIIKFILTTEVFNMLTEKENYNEQLIIEVEHQYSSDPDSE